MTKRTRRNPLPDAVLEKSSTRRPLKKRADPNQSVKNGCTAFIAAAANSTLATVKLMVEAGANVNEGDRDGFTPLMSAAGAGKARTVRFLIERGANVDQVDNLSRTALSWAATKNDSPETVVALLACGANPDHVDGMGVTPLMRCALIKLPKGFEALLKGGARVDVKREQSGKTALIMANESRHPDMIKMVDQIAKKRRRS